MDPRRRRTLRAFRRGLARDEIELVFQPQVVPATGRVQAVEALVRWRRPSGLQAPDTFLPIVEGTPMMAALTDRVLDLALAQLAVWRHDGREIRMSANLSANDLSDAALPERVAAALRRHAVSGAHLTLEVTETAILEDSALARRTLDAITRLGVEIAVDDFGTGHASIARLHDLPVREVKIDRSFVTGADDRSRVYLAAMIRFGQELSLRIVAEGVEDDATLSWLDGLGCELAQGYGISRPLDAEVATALLHDGVISRSGATVARVERLRVIGQVG